ncbi:MAG: cytochrome c maturation protein CcmE [Ardenticatenaceae bacterium]|nr:cytochrome c maturation protein CcmE [Ardenticatenaceae bacterium]
MTAIPHPQKRIGPIPRTKVKFFAGGAIIILAIAALIFNGVRTAGNYYITLDELATKGDRAIGQGLRISAPVDMASVNYDTQKLVLSFDMVDQNSGARQHVVYHNVMPDLFMKSESVIVEGRLDESHVFQAQTILVKCPSKYQSAIEAGQPVPADHLNQN